MSTSDSGSVTESSVASCGGASLRTGGGGSDSGSVTESSSSTCACAVGAAKAARGESKRRFLFGVGGERRDEDGDLRLRGVCGGDSGSKIQTFSKAHICG